MSLIVREMEAADRAAWVEMRGTLWSGETPQAHASAIDLLFGRGDAWGFITEMMRGTPGGFAEVAIRKYANGCDSQPVPFLEGIWVKGRFRRQGVGARLIEHPEAFLAARGFHKLESDTEIGNRSSRRSPSVGLL